MDTFHQWMCWGLATTRPPALKDLTDNFLEDILKNINIPSGFQNEFACSVSAIVRTKQHGTIANRS